MIEARAGAGEIASGEGQLGWTEPIAGGAGPFEGPDQNEIFPSTRGPRAPVTAGTLPAEPNSV